MGLSDNAKNRLFIATTDRSVGDEISDAIDTAWASAIAGELEEVNLGQTLRLYVSPTGNDSNDGRGVGSPWKSVKKALGYVQRNVRLVGGGVAEVHLADGTYDSEDLSIETIVPTNGSVLITGGRKTPAVDGLTEGTVTSSTGQTQFTVTGANWTPGQLVGKLFAVGNFAQFQPSPIVANTADTVTVAVDWYGSQNGQSFTIFEPGATISGGAQMWMRNGTRAATNSGGNNAVLFRNVDFGGGISVQSGEFSFFSCRASSVKLSGGWTNLFACSHPAGGAIPISHSASASLMVGLTWVSFSSSGGGVLDVQQEDTVVVDSVQMIRGASLHWRSNLTVLLTSGGSFNLSDAGPCWLKLYVEGDGTHTFSLNTNSHLSLADGGMGGTPSVGAISGIANNYVHLVDVTVTDVNLLGANNSLRVGTGATISGNINYGPTDTITQANLDLDADKTVVGARGTVAYIE